MIQTPKPISIGNQEVEIGISSSDESLSFCDHVEYVCKTPQRRFFLAE